MPITDTNIYSEEQLKKQIVKAAPLPPKLLYLPNNDKSFHERWETGRDMLNIPHPFRAVLLGRPNVGKTNIIINLILRCNFEEIFVIHCDGDYTKEYDEVGATMLKSIPPPTEWKGKNKTLVILDDLEYRIMNKEQKQNLDRLFGYVSTHKNISVCLTAQDPFNVTPNIRRMSNLFILWKGIDLDSMANIARKCGIKKDEFLNLFDKYATKPRDSIWLDLSDKTPYPLRKNGYEIIS